jgi:tRNA (guanine-N7-)-methyltransferase
LIVRHRARLPLPALAPFCWEPPRIALPAQSSPRISWHDVFDNDHPVEVEVGFGKGLFLVTTAESSPGHNFLGIEVLRGLQLYAATRLAKRQLANAKVACTDARWFFRACIPGQSLRAVHVYFPDPWWKVRHKKRRVFTAEFAADVERTLQPSGKLFIATDVEEYFGVMTGLVAERNQLVEISRTVASGIPEPDAILTNFERKARHKGGCVWRAEYERQS